MNLHALLLTALIIIITMLPINASSEVSQYADLPLSEIKAITPEDYKGLSEGQGMGLARAAELNHYPGPKHVLEIGTELKLDQNQLDSTKELFERMRRSALDIGQQIIAKELDLDRLFASERISQNMLNELTAELGVLQGKLRYVHLLAHLEMKAILTPHQVRMYDRLRGYQSEMGHRHKGH